MGFKNKYKWSFNLSNEERGDYIMKGVKLAYDLIIKDDNGKAKRISEDTLDSLGIDYQSMLKELMAKEEWVGDDEEDVAISLIHEEKLLYKVLYALVNKDLITKDNVKHIELYVMVWQYAVSGKHAEYGYVNAGSFIQLDKPFNIND